MIEIDGTHGEGGGQILRSALGLSLLTGQPFRITDIRGGRKKPGLLNQHLTAVRAAATIGCARVEGATLRSSEVTFSPGAFAPGEHHFDVGTSGSASLVLQAVLPALLTATATTTIVIRGGTHNDFAPPYEFLARSFVTQLARMGANVSLTLERHGFHPAGGGCLRTTVDPVPRLEPLTLTEAGGKTRHSTTALVSGLPVDIGHREVDVIGRSLQLGNREREVVDVPSDGPGNAVIVTLEFERVTAVFTGFGRRGVPAEKIARGVARDARHYLALGAPVDEHLADQLLIPLAMAGEGEFRTGPPSLHARTNMDVIERFLDVRFDTRENPDGTVTIGV